MSYLVERDEEDERIVLQVKEKGGGYLYVCLGLLLLFAV